MTQNRLARMLMPLRIGPGYIGPETERKRGYVREHFKEAFERYLPPEGASEPCRYAEADEMGTSEISEVCSPGNGCTDAKSQKSNNDGLLHTCTVVKGGNGVEGHSGQEIAQPDEAADGLDMPPDCRRCLHCNGNGAVNEVALPDRTVWLHRECEKPWLATHHKQASRQTP
jgi:hypothetical protein